MEKKLTLDQILSDRQSLGTKLDNGFISLEEYRCRINYLDSLISKMYNSCK